MSGEIERKRQRISMRAKDTTVDYSYSKFCDVDTFQYLPPSSREAYRTNHLRTSVSPRGRLCNGRPEDAMAVVVVAAVAVVAAAAAAAIRCGACCDGCSLVAPPFSPVKIIRGQGERGSDGTIEQWNDGSGSRVANERERTSETRKLKISTDKINTHQPPALGYRRR